MLPVLQIGPFALQTHLLALLLAGWAGLAAASRVSGYLGIDGDHLYNAGLTGLVGGLIAGRVAHVIAFLPAYLSQPLEIFGLNPSAFQTMPGAIGALLVAAWYVARHRLPWAPVLDATATGALVAVAIERGGALLAGRTPGTPTTVPWAIPLWGVTRHPSQVYEMVAALGVLAAALWVVKRQAQQQLRFGGAFWVAVLGYGLSRWLLEPFRADSATVLGRLRTAQILGLALALVAIWALRRRAVGAVVQPEP